MDTTSHKGMYTQEANEEARAITKSKKNYVDPAGKATKKVEKELIQTFYNFTKKY